MRGLPPQLHDFAVFQARTGVGKVLPEGAVPKGNYHVLRPVAQPAGKLADTPAHGLNALGLVEHPAAADTSATTVAALLVNYL